MRTVGSFFAKQRLKQGLTLEMVSVDTRISLGNLEAIEADELGHFTSPFFYKSFVKQFAAALQLDTREFAEMLGSQAGAIPAPPVPGEDHRTLPNVPALATSPWTVCNPLGIPGRHLAGRADWVFRRLRLVGKCPRYWLQHRGILAQQGLFATRQACFRFACAAEVQGAGQRCPGFGRIRKQLLVLHNRVAASSDRDYAWRHPSGTGRG